MSNPTYYPGRATPAVAVTPAGSGQTDGGALVLGTVNTVSGADGTKGVQLPAAKAGEELFVYSSTATNALLVWPQTGGAIDAGSANASFSLAARKPAHFKCLDGLNWIAVVSA